MLLAELFGERQRVLCEFERGTRVSCVAGRAARFGADHPRTLHGRLELSGWLGDTGQFDQAKAMSAQTTDDSTSSLGRDHELTLAGRHQTAVWTALSGDPGSAASQFRDLVSDARRLLGDTHPLTENCQKHLQDSRHNDGYYLPATW